MERGTEMEDFDNESLIEIEQAENDQEALDSLASDLLEKIKQFNEGDGARFTVLMPAGTAAEKFLVILKDRMAEVDFSRVHFIQGEQLWPIPKDHPASLLGGMEKVLSESNVPEENIHIFDSEAESEVDATSNVREALDFGIDYAVVGLNSSGAIAGLRDGEEFKTKHLDMVDLDLKTPELHSRENLGMADLPYVSMDQLVRKMNEEYWPDDPENRPRRMFAPGWKHMLEAGQLAILATGESKKEAVRVAFANIGIDVPIKGPDNNLVDVIAPGKRDIDDQNRHLTSTGEIALSRRKDQLSTRIYTDYPLK